MDDIQRVGVVGAGLMDSGIAEVRARTRLDVVVREIDHEAAAPERARITGSLDREPGEGKRRATAEVVDSMLRSNQ